MIKIHNTFSKEIKDIWLDLEQESDTTPFQSYKWLLNWHQTAGKNYNLFLTCVVLDGQVQAIFPFGIDSSKFIKKLEWLGGSHNDYMAPIIRTSAQAIFNDFNNIWSQVLCELPKFDLLFLAKQIPTIGDYKNPFLQIYTSQQAMTSYQKKFTSESDNYYAGISKKVLADSQRQRKRLSELGALEFNILDPNQTKNYFLETMFLFKRLRYRQMGVDDHLSSKNHQDFYLNMPAQISSSSRTHLSTLTLNKEIIALHWGLISNNKFYYLMPAHEGTKWAKFSPGKLLLEELLQWSHQHKVSSFDFTGGEEPYKKIWSNQSFGIYQTTRSFSLLGRTYLFLMTCGRAIKKILSNILK